MNHYEGENIGSIAQLEIAFFYDFLSFNPAVLDTGRTWKKAPFKEQTGVLNFKVESTDHGMIYSYTGSFFLQRIREEIKRELYPYLGDQLILRITDMNGDVYLIGSPEVPASLSLSATTGETVNQENGQKFTFKVEQTHLAYTQ